MQYFVGRSSRVVPAFCQKRGDVALLKGMHAHLSSPVVLIVSPHVTLLRTRYNMPFLLQKKLPDENKIIIIHGSFFALYL